jgi:hypothetical protein
MSLPESGWRGYGRPGLPSPDLRQAAAHMRALALSYDAQAAALLEAGFVQWSRETVYPAAVNRLIREAGR